MSADSFIAWFGLRFEIDPKDVEAVELRSDRRTDAARRVGLKTYWGDFDAGGGKYLLLVGTELGIFGLENRDERSIAADDMRNLMDRTRDKLAEAGFDGIPAVHLIWQPDA